MIYQVSYGLDVGRSSHHATALSRDGDRLIDSEVANNENASHKAVLELLVKYGGPTGIKAVGRTRVRRILVAGAPRMGEKMAETAGEPRAGPLDHRGPGAAIVGVGEAFGVPPRRTPSVARSGRRRRAVGHHPGSNGSICGSDQRPPVARVRRSDRRSAARRCSMRQ